MTLSQWTVLTSQPCTRWAAGLKRFTDQTSPAGLAPGDLQITADMMTHEHQQVLEGHNPDLVPVKWCTREVQHHVDTPKNALVITFQLDLFCSSSLSFFCPFRYLFLPWDPFVQSIINSYGLGSIVLLLLLLFIYLFSNTPHQWTDTQGCGAGLADAKLSPFFYFFIFFI